MPISSDRAALRDLPLQPVGVLVSFAARGRFLPGPACGSSCRPGYSCVANGLADGAGRRRTTSAGSPPWTRSGTPTSASRPRRPSNTCPSWSAGSRPSARPGRRAGPVRPGRGLLCLRHPAAPPDPARGEPVHPPHLQRMVRPLSLREADRRPAAMADAPAATARPRSSSSTSCRARPTGRRVLEARTPRQPGPLPGGLPGPRDRPPVVGPGRHLGHLPGPVAERGPGPVRRGPAICGTRWARTSTAACSRSSPAGRPRNPDFGPDHPRHAAAATSTSSAYQAIVYDKSALVMGMLLDLMGEEPFFRGLRAFFAAQPRPGRPDRGLRPGHGGGRRARPEAVLRPLVRLAISCPRSGCRTSVQTAEEASVLRFHVTQTGPVFVFPLWVSWAENGRTVRRVLEVDRGEPRRSTCPAPAARAGSRSIPTGSSPGGSSESPAIGTHA